MKNFFKKILKYFGWNFYYEWEIQKEEKFIFKTWSNAIRSKRAALLSLTYFTETHPKDKFRLKNIIIFEKIYK